MIHNILSQIPSIPGDVAAFFSGSTVRLIIGIVFVVLFLLATILSKKAGNIVRIIYIALSALFMIHCLIKKEYSLMLALIGLIILMIIIKIIITISKSIKESRETKQFERKALAKAAKRRGSWQNKKGYSGKAKPIVAEQYKPEKMNKEDIREIVDNETSKKVSNTEEVDEQLKEKKEYQVREDTIDLKSLKIDENLTLAEIIARENAANNK